MIKITFSTLDGVRKVHKFTTLGGARRFAVATVGAQDVEGGYYAVSDDGVAKITWQGVSRAQLFGAEAVKAKEESFVAVRNGRTYELHAGKPCLANFFATAFEVMDTVTGDYPDGWALKGGQGFEDWLTTDRHYATLAAALADAKAIHKAYCDHCAAESAAEAYAEGAWLRAAEQGSWEDQIEEDREREMDRYR